MIRSVPFKLTVSKTMLYNGIQLQSHSPSRRETLNTLLLGFYYNMIWRESLSPRPNLGLQLKLRPR